MTQLLLHRKLTVLFKKNYFAIEAPTQNMQKVGHTLLRNVAGRTRTCLFQADANGALRTRGL